jgi:hypothetical protein
LSNDFYDEALDQIKKVFEETKNKSLKAHRTTDLLAEAFPEDKYDIMYLFLIVHKYLRIKEKMMPQPEEPPKELTPTKEQQIEDD